MQDEEAWTDDPEQHPLVVWTEPGGRVAIYHGEANDARNRHVLNRREALRLARLLIRAALP